MLLYGIINLLYIFIYYIKTNGPICFLNVSNKTGSQMQNRGLSRKNRRMVTLNTDNRLHRYRLFLHDCKGLKIVFCKIKKFQITNFWSANYIMLMGLQKYAKNY